MRSNYWLECVLNGIAQSCYRCSPVCRASWIGVLDSESCELRLSDWPIDDLLVLTATGNICDDQEEVRMCADRARRIYLYLNRSKLRASEVCARWTCITTTTTMMIAAAVVAADRKTNSFLSFLKGCLYAQKATCLYLLHQVCHK